MVERVYDNPDIYKIQVPLRGNALRVLNSYVICSHGEVLLIDTGFRREECRQALLEGLQELGLTVADCRLFLTHFHSDHIGLAEMFSGEKEEEEPAVYMGRTDYEYFRYIKTGDYEKEIDLIYEREGFPVEDLREQKKENPARIYGVKDVFPVKILDNGDYFMVGEVKLQAIEFGGHTPGHMCLYMPKEQIMFLGDHVLYDITPNVMEWPHITNSLGRYLSSLSRIKTYPVKLALPAHRGGNEKALYQRVDELIGHHKNRLAEVRNILRLEGKLTCYEVASRMKWSLHGKTWDTAPKQQKWFAMGEARAHLIHLVTLGIVARDESGKRVKYYIEDLNRLTKSS